MDVRLSYGIYAGQIREMEPTVARELIASGRATDPHAPAKEIAEPAQQRQNKSRR